MDDTDASRRRYLHAIGGVSIAALAGCLGDGGGGEPTEEEMMEETSTEDGMMEETATDDSMTSTEDGMMEETATEDGMMATTFEVAVENVSSGDTLSTADGGVAVPLSPGAYAVHSGMATLFAPGESASDGLESLAEDGKPGGLAEEVAGAEGVHDSGAFTTPDGADGPAPLKPGDSYSFEVQASAEADPALSLATMFVQSNDLFYAPSPEGVALFEDSEPVEGDVTGAFQLWDAGTEENQPPGEGADQAPRQSGTDTGPEESAPVRAITEVDDGFDYPAVDEVLRVTVTTM